MKAHFCQGKTERNAETGQLSIGVRRMVGWTRPA